VNHQSVVVRNSAWTCTIGKKLAQSEQSKGATGTTDGWSRIAEKRIFPGAKFMLIILTKNYSIIR
jgi:hypothetical protein